jgi:hypothetical protein
MAMKLRSVEKRERKPRKKYNKITIKEMEIR